MVRGVVVMDNLFVYKLDLIEDIVEFIRVKVLSLFLYFCDLFYWIMVVVIEIFLMKFFFNFKYLSFI